jgi:uncharacterized protein (DUF39 family)
MVAVLNNKLKAYIKSIKHSTIKLSILDKEIRSRVTARGKNMTATEVESKRRQRDSLKKDNDNVIREYRELAASAPKIIRLRYTTKK